MAESAHGLPNWTDLHTAEAEQCLAFYSALLGWEYRRKPALAAVPTVEQTLAKVMPSEDRSTAVATLDGSEVAEIVTRGGSFDAKHLDSNWFPYVQVADIEATLELVEPAGGLVLSPPAMRDDNATVASVIDPSDALLRVWQPGPDGGSRRSVRRGTSTWIELETNDIDRACKFYGCLFGWDAGEVPNPMGGDPYVIFSHHGDPVAGAVTTLLSDIPASWCTAFTVADTDRATRRATEMGAVVMAEPTEMARGRQAVLVDPTGVLFGLLGPAATGPRPL